MENNFLAADEVVAELIAHRGDKQRCLLRRVEKKKQRPQFAAGRVALVFFSGRAMRATCVRDFTRRSEGRCGSGGRTRPQGIRLPPFE